MMYTRTQFGLDLKEKVSRRDSVENIGCWAYSIYLEYIENIDNELSDILLTLNTMEDGPEFAFSYEELEKLADDLFAGNDVSL